MKTATERLQLNVKLWTDGAGYTKEQVKVKVADWCDFGYSLAEQDAAKAEVLATL